MSFRRSCLHLFAPNILAIYTISLAASKMGTVCSTLTYVPRRLIRFIFKLLFIFMILPFRLFFYFFPQHFDYSKREIFMRMVTSKIPWLEVESNRTIGAIKVKIQDREGIPTDRQRLVYSGKQLEVDRSLGDYDIYRPSTIHLVPRLSRHE